MYWRLSLQPLELRHAMFHCREDILEAVERFKKAYGH